MKAARTNDRTFALPEPVFVTMSEGGVLVVLTLVSVEVVQDVLHPPYVSVVRTSRTSYMQPRPLLGIFPEI